MNDIWPAIGKHQLAILILVTAFWLPACTANAECPQNEFHSYQALAKWVASEGKNMDSVDLIISACGLRIARSVGVNRDLAKVWVEFGNLKSHDFALIPLLDKPCDEFKCFGLTSARFVQAANSFDEHRRLRAEDWQQTLGLILSLFSMAVAACSLIISFLKFKRGTSDLENSTKAEPADEPT